jgi:GH25 family lysozyme M1 (1,4-beta-N-acetylmuramidase)
LCDPEASIFFAVKEIRHQTYLACIKCQRLYLQLSTQQMATRKKKKTSRSIILVVMVFAGMSVAAWWWYRYHATNFVTYPEFGIAVPSNYEIHGIDVSHHQDNINWDLVKSMQVKDIKIGFAFIKATEGVGRVDSRFNRNWFGAKDAGMCRGAYHFFLARKSGRPRCWTWSKPMAYLPSSCVKK